MILHTVSSVTKEGSKVCILFNTNKKGVLKIDEVITFWVLGTELSKWKPKCKEGH